MIRSVLKIRFAWVALPLVIGVLAPLPLLGAALITLRVHHVPPPSIEPGQKLTLVVDIIPSQQVSVAVINWRMIGEEQYRRNRMKLIDRYLGIPLLYLVRGCKTLFSRRRPDPVQVERILMIKLWGIGNLVMILPLIRAVRRHYPRAKIHFLTLEHNADLLRAVTGLDRLITFEPSGLASTLIDLVRTTFSLRAARSCIANCRM